MMNAFLLHQILKRLVVEFLPVVRLEIDGFSTAFQDLGHGFRHRFTRLALQGLDPGVLGKHVHHRQEITIPSIVLGDIDHLYQVGRLLLVDSVHHDRSRGAATAKIFVPV